MGDGPEYIISTWAIDEHDKLDKLDTKQSSREKDGATIRLPSIINACPLQLWEVYLAATILLMQPHSSIIFAHVKALCEHNDQNYLCEAVLKEHLNAGTVIDDTQDVNMYTFLDEYFNRKFQITFPKTSMHTYIEEALDDARCGRNGVSRVFLLGPHLQAFLLNSQFFENQYDELVRALRVAHLPVNDVMLDGEEAIGEALDIRWDNVKLYDDPHLVLKKHGGWALTKPTRMMTPKDQLILRLTGCTLEQLLAGKDVPDSPRKVDDESLEHGVQRKGTRHRSHRKSSLQGSDAAALTVGGEVGADGASKSVMLTHLEEQSSDSSHPSDFDVDPEHKKVVPFGLSICEMYMLLRGLLVGLDTHKSDLRGCVVGEKVARGTRDGHILTAAVFADLYMREQIDVCHWTLSEGSIAVPYKVTKRKGIPPMEHFLDDYCHDLESMFRNMLVAGEVAEAPIWASLEERGIIDNHRPSWERAYGCGFTKVDVWDLARPDLLLDLKEGYLLAARVLYDKKFHDPLDEESNDVLMFCFVMQHLFDLSLEAVDGLSRVLTHMCPPFQKGELFPPATMVHGGAVILGLIDRGFRVANNTDSQLAQEAAEFNQSVMERLEEQFFLSDRVMTNLDADGSGEVTLDEFIDGFRKIDLYKDFRKERMPEDVLRTIVVDLAERLFYEVDVNMDGTLTPQELASAFGRRREEALKKREGRKWVRRATEAVAVQMGLKSKSRPRDEVRANAVKHQDKERKEAYVNERRRRQEWQAEVERPELLDADVDVDTSLLSDNLTF
mmetsp:Transcript_21888/g.75281  ORF Transcript_21888/g.75281 Transcript_21888/m.75281 type:complete len:782 (+) Transcript_21888:161-2506(+)